MGVTEENSVSDKRKLVVGVFLHRSAIPTLSQKPSFLQNVTTNYVRFEVRLQDKPQRIKHAPFGRRRKNRRDSRKGANRIEGRRREKRRLFRKEKQKEEGKEAQGKERGPNCIE